MIRIQQKLTVEKILLHDYWFLKNLINLTFICFMSSNICSGGKLATACVIASGASSGATAGPYGFTSGRLLPSIPRK